MFLYVFDKELRDILIDKGFTLLKSDDKNHTYVFQRDDSLRFSLTEHTYVFSDVLTF